MSRTPPHGLGWLYTKFQTQIHPFRGAQRAPKTICDLTVLLVIDRRNGKKSLNKTLKLNFRSCLEPLLMVLDECIPNFRPKFIRLEVPNELRRQSATWQSLLVVDRRNGKKSLNKTSEFIHLEVPKELQTQSATWESVQDVNGHNSKKSRNKYLKISWNSFKSIIDEVGMS